jgi:hypothetical protein
MGKGKLNMRKKAKAAFQTLLEGYYERVKSIACVPLLWFLLAKSGLPLGTLGSLVTQRWIVHSNAKSIGPGWFSATVNLSEVLARVVYRAGKTNLGGGSGSPSSQPAGTSIPTVIVTRYSPGGNRLVYSPSLERIVEIGRPLAGKKFNVPLVMASPR